MVIPYVYFDYWVKMKRFRNIPLYADNLVFCLLLGLFIDQGDGNAPYIDFQVWVLLLNKFIS